MRYGYFDDAYREYVVTSPQTPLPWINFLGSEDFFGVISNTAGGYSFYQDARLRRLTRYRHNNAPLDMGGRYIYLRDDGADRAGPLYWSPSWMPTRHPLEAYECRHGMGYTTICSRLGGIEAQTRYFVPLGQNLEVWDLTLTNQRAKPAELSIFAAVEFCLWDALEDATNLQRNLSTGEVELPTNSGTIIHKTEYRERRSHFAYFASSEQPAGFDTDREAFLGPYRGWDAPLALERGQASGSQAHGWQPIGAYHVRTRIEPGGQRRLIFLLGYHENAPEAKFDPPDSQNVNRRTLSPVLDTYLKPHEVDDAFEALKRYWNDLLAVFTVNTPDVHVNRMLNIWNVYQMMVTFNISRSASYFESGITRGIGFRDSNQDLLGFVPFAPGRARRRILELGATQLATGGAYHQYQPLSRRGNNDIGSGFHDDPLWLVLSVAAYIRETGDWAILDEPVPFDNAAGSERPLSEHVQRSIQYTLDRLGPHGLPLIGRADWNDCLNLNCFSTLPGEPFQSATNKDGRVAESVFIAGLFVLAARELAELVTKWRAVQRELPEDTVSADTYSEAAQRMEAAIRAFGWDGEWFLRAYDDYGRAVGSRENREGSIFIESQGMCVMAGVGLQDGLARKALDSVAARLATPHGLVLVQPAFTSYQLHLGEITSYPPGYKENAGIFCHTNPWITIAEAIIGRGDRALDYALRINPSRREELSDVHRCEPYVYAQMIAGRDAPTHGEAKNSWLTGAAAWSYVAMTQWVLGIRPTYDGLGVAPVIPASWRGFEAQRTFRGTRYDIHVERRGAGNELHLEVDGRPLAGEVVPLPSAGTSQVHVHVTLR